MEPEQVKSGGSVDKACVCLECRPEASPLQQIPTAYIRVV
jgi:hypothetical protein